MTLDGINVKVSIENKEQYDSLNQLWTILEQYYDCEDIFGLGYGWDNDSMNYLIGINRGMINENALKEIKEEFPSAENKRITVPTDGWKTYRGSTWELQDLYSIIWEEGEVIYELESFTNDGKCKILIYR